MKVGISIFVREDKVYDYIKEAHEQGFDNGQLLYWNMSYYTDENAELVKKACKDFGFTVTAVWCGWSGPRGFAYPGMYNRIGIVPSDWRAKRVEELLLGAEFARKIGVSDIITHIGYLPDNPYDPDNIGVVNALTLICNKLKPYNQNFLFETGEELPLSLAYLIRDIGADNIGINFDPANLIMNGRGSHPVTALKFLAPYIRGVHAKDALQPTIPELKKVEVPAGEGDVNFPEFIKTLKEIGYDGAISIEYEKYEGDRNAKLAQIKSYLEGLIG